MTELKPISEINKELYTVLAPKELTRFCKFTFRHEYGDDTVLVLLSKYWDTGNTTTIEYIKDGDTEACCGTLNNEGCNFEDIKIIGHEPTLDNIILWMCDLFVVEKKNITELLLKLHFTVIGRSVDYPDGYQELAKKALEVLGKYDLGSGFDGQREETKRKLHSLICTNS